jgi:hypothetical protein
MTNEKDAGFRQIEKIHKPQPTRATVQNEHTQCLKLAGALYELVTKVEKLGLKYCGTYENEVLNAVSAANRLLGRAA